MLIVITGGSGSGKSVYAEQLLTKLTDTEKYYIATMQPFGEETKKRIARHQKQRQGNNFITVEQYVKIETADIPIGASVLLECMSNLVANEMFNETNTRQSNEIYDDIISGIEQLCKRCKHLVIVTNEVFSDGNCYDKETRKYIACLGLINQRLAQLADSMVEVVYSIPVCIKGAFQWTL